MKSAPEGDEQRRWGEAIQVVRPSFVSGGTHVNISGAAVAKHAPNRANAVKLLEYLVSDGAQSLYAQSNFEYPVKKGVQLDPIVASFGAMKADRLPIADIVAQRKRASVLVDKVGFDQ
jgi:iron(III) transport system substrate-binding protein